MVKLSDPWFLPLDNEEAINRSQRKMQTSQVYNQQVTYRILLPL